MKQEREEKKDKRRKKKKEKKKKGEEENKGGERRHENRKEVIPKEPQQHIATQHTFIYLFMFILFLKIIYSVALPTDPNRNVSLSRLTEAGSVGFNRMACFFFF